NLSQEHSDGLLLPTCRLSPVHQIPSTPVARVARSGLATARSGLRAARGWGCCWCSPVAVRVPIPKEGLARGVSEREAAAGLAVTVRLAAIVRLAARTRLAAATLRAAAVRWALGESVFPAREERAE